MLEDFRQAAQEETVSRGNRLDGSGENGEGTLTQLQFVCGELMAGSRSLA